jgi:hypothetical protein
MIRLLLDLSDKAEAAGTLLLFVAGTAVSIALLSFVFGLDIARGPGGHKLERDAPDLVFGERYAFGALGLVVYPL